MTPAYRIEVNGRSVKFFPRNSVKLHYAAQELIPRGLWNAIPYEVDLTSTYHIYKRIQRTGVDIEVSLPKRMYETRLKEES